MTQNIDCSGDGEALESVEPLIPSSAVISHWRCRSKDALEWDVEREGEESSQKLGNAYLKQQIHINFISVEKFYVATL